MIDRHPYYVVMDEATRSPRGSTDQPTSLMVKHNGAVIDDIPANFDDRDRLDIVVNYGDGSNAVYASLLIFPEVAMILRGSGQPFWVEGAGINRALRQEWGSALQYFGFQLVTEAGALELHTAPQP